MSGIDRRDLLAQSASLLLGATIDAPPLIAERPRTVAALQAGRAGPPLTTREGEVYSAADGRRYERLSTSYNRRFECLKPAIIVYCRSKEAVCKSIRWCRENGVEFAVRSGGHCYEGSSRSNHVVIDLRGLDAIEFSPRRRAIHVGGGAKLGDVYRTVGRAAQAIAAGTCPTIGLAGHALAGGLGFLVRQFGLACDNVRSFEIANADGDIDIADESTNADLYWALRGAGQASFGIVTGLTLATHSVPSVVTYDCEVTAATSAAARFLSRWQTWIRAAGPSVSSSIFAKKLRSNAILLDMRGAILDAAGSVRSQLEPIVRELGGRPRLQFNARTFDQMVRWFSAGEDGSPVYEKGKSDIVRQSLGEDAFRFVLGALPVEVDAEFTALGGAVDRIAKDQTAFPHRGDASLVIQWGVSWDRPDQARAQLMILDGFYAKIRPYMSGSAFLNYIDRDIRDPARAYWGANLQRLVSIKRKFDPDNIFRHVMSVPTELSSDDSTDRAAALYCSERN